MTHFWNTCTNAYIRLHGSWKLERNWYDNAGGLGTGQVRFLARVWVTFIGHGLGRVGSGKYPCICWLTPFSYIVMRIGPLWMCPQCWAVH